MLQKPFLICTPMVRFIFHPTAILVWGLDIFKAKKSTDGKWEIENMRYPINSSSDDFGICFERDREAGYLSSTRKGKVDDIYAFVLPPLKFSITGVVKTKNR